MQNVQKINTTKFN